MGNGRCDNVAWSPTSHCDGNVTTKSPPGSQLSTPAGPSAADPPPHPPARPTAQVAPHSGSAFLHFSHDHRCATWGARVSILAGTSCTSVDARAGHFSRDWWGYLLACSLPLRLPPPRV